jgi:hypothetical protein
VSISAKIGCAVQTLNKRVKKADVERNRRAGISRQSFVAGGCGTASHIPALALLWHSAWND